VRASLRGASFWTRTARSRSSFARAADASGSRRSRPRHRPSNPSKHGEVCCRGGGPTDRRGGGPGLPVMRKVDKARLDLKATSIEQTGRAAAARTVGAKVARLALSVGGGCGQHDESAAAIPSMALPRCSLGVLAQARPFERPVECPESGAELSSASGAARTLARPEQHAAVMGPWSGKQPGLKPRRARLRPHRFAQAGQAGHQ